MKAITFACPDDLAEKLNGLVQSGWEDTCDHALVEALRRYLRLQQPEVLERQLKADIEWGLHGRE